MKRRASIKRLVALVVVTCGVSSADSITIGDTKYEGVFVTESSTRYIVSDPKDGSIRAFSREHASNWQKSEDRDAILLRWKEARGIKAVTEKGDTDLSKSPEDSDSSKEEKDPIRIEHHGDYKPDPAFRNMLRERHMQQDIAERNQRWLNSPEGQAETAKREYRRRLESQSKYQKKMWQEYGIPADQSTKPLITDRSGTIVRR